MIFDRTQADVTAALRIRENKIKRFAPPTENEAHSLERGFIDYTTLNRIENKQAELRELLISSGSSFFDIKTKTWTADDIFNETEFQRMVNNLDVLKSAISVLPDTPETPQPIFYFININDIEKILFDMDVLLQNMISAYWFCGELYCGEMEE